MPLNNIFYTNHRRKQITLKGNISYVRARRFYGNPRLVINDSSSGKKKISSSDRKNPWATKSLVFPIFEINFLIIFPWNEAD